MRSLKDENHKQNFEIVSLKATLQLQNTTINQHETTIKELMGQSVISLSRRKRPAQLIPSSIPKGERKNDADKENCKRFYGPPTNCSDLTRLGYTSVSTKSKRLWLITNTYKPQNLRPCIALSNKKGPTIH